MLTFGEFIKSTHLQKLLFLLTREQQIKSYDFIPYHFGCFSFQANKDLMTLYNKGILTKKVKDKTTSWKVNDQQNFDVPKISKIDSEILKVVQNKYFKSSQEDLIKYTYLKYPYWAIKSSIAKEILSQEELAKVHEQNKVFDESTLFTIGYEGKSLESYINKLIINDVRLLCDIRKNPISMKYGFSKKTLSNACEGVGIKYVHIPELGINSNKRKDLNNRQDYSNLFKEYKRTILLQNNLKLLEIKKQVKEYQRLSLTCFERDPKYCHRGVVANTLSELPDWDIPIKHL